MAEVFLGSSFWLIGLSFLTFGKVSVISLDAMFQFGNKTAEKKCGVLEQHSDWSSGRTNAQPGDRKVGIQEL